MIEKSVPAAVAGDKAGILWVGIILLGVGLRFYGLDWGTDSDGVFHPLHPDETTLINAASQLRENLKPTITAYGTLPMYLLYLFGQPSAIMLGESLFASESQSFTYTVARALSALFSVLTIWFTFAIGKRIGDERVGLLAAAFLAVMVLPIQLSHFYTVDSLFVALATLSLYQSVKAGQQGYWCDYAWTGVVVGLATSVRLGGILLLVPLVIPRLLRPRPCESSGSSESWSRQALWLLGPPSLALGVVLVMVALLQPHMVLDPADYWRTKGGGDLMTSIGIASGEIPRTWTLYDSTQPRFLFHLTNLLYFAVGLPLQLVGLLGLVFLAKRAGAGHLQILAWCAVYFLTVGGLQAKNIRYLAPLLPFLALGAAYLCLTAHRVSGGRLRIFTSVGITSVLVYSAAYAVGFCGIYGAIDSRIEAGSEIGRRFPAASTIGVEHTGLSMEPHLPSGHRVQKIRTGTLFNLDRYLLATEKIELLFQWLQGTDGLAFIDAGRGNHFMAVPKAYPIEYQFYKKLYAGELGFDKVQSYRRYPSILGFDFDDSTAEISFYAFDHPRVTLFSRSGSETELARAKDLWKRSASSSDNLTDKYVTGGIDALLSDRLEDAERSLKAALRIRPDYTLAHLLLSGLYERLGSATLATESWNRALATTSFQLLRDRLFVNDLEGLYLAGEKLLAVGAPHTGRRCLQLAESHGGATLLREIGYLYLHHQMPANAVSIFERLIGDEPSVAAHYADLCKAYVAVDNLERARMIYGFYAELENDGTKREELRQHLESAGLSLKSE